MNMSMPPSLNARVRFAGWKQEPTALRQSVEQLEQALERPVAPESPVEVATADYPAVHQPEIQALKEMLEKVTDNNGYGMKDAIYTLKVTEQTGYQLTPDEADKLQILIKKSGYDLRSAIENFPNRNQFSSEQFTEQDIVRVLGLWVKEQTQHRPLVDLMETIDRAERFQAPAAVNAVLSERLETLKAGLTKPDVHQAYLASLGHYFRPQFELVADVQKVMDALLPDENLFAQNRTDSVQQAVDLAARRSARVKYAGQAADGNLYLITEGLDGRKTQILYGEPGALQELTDQGGISAMDGSDTYLNTAEGVSFNFKRGGLFDHNDKSRWQATINDVPVAFEYPTDELEPERR